MTTLGVADGSEGSTAVGGEGTGRGTLREWGGDRAGAETKPKPSVKRGPLEASTGQQGTEGRCIRGLNLKRGGV